MGLRTLPRSGAWGVRHTAVRRHRLALVLTVATYTLAASTVPIPAARAANANPMTPGPQLRRRPRHAADGMADRQITLIAAAPAAATATAAVLLDRARAAPGRLGRHVMTRPPSGH